MKNNSRYLELLAESIMSTVTLLSEKKRNVIAHEDEVLRDVQHKDEGGVPLVGQPQHAKVKGERLAARVGADKAKVTAAIAARRERKEGAGNASMRNILTLRGTPEQQVQRRAMKGAAIEARRAKEAAWKAKGAAWRASRVKPPAKPPARPHDRPPARPHDRPPARPR